MSRGFCTLQRYKGNFDHLGVIFCLCEFDKCIPISTYYTHDGIFDSAPLYFEWQAFPQSLEDITSGI